MSCKSLNLKGIESIEAVKILENIAEIAPKYSSLLYGQSEKSCVLILNISFDFKCIYRSS
jgi:hypothetical protein